MTFSRRKGIVLGLSLQDTHLCDSQEHAIPHVKDEQNFSRSHLLLKFQEL